MLGNIKQIFAPKNKDLRKRILFTLGVLVIFLIGASVKIPGTKSINSNLGFLELLNAMGGGALKRASIFALGVMPYISASIVVQLLEMDIVPYFSELAKEGYTGRRKLNRITRYAGLAIAFVQGLVYSLAILGNGCNSI